ncbi:MAG: hypothetical protein NXI31_01790 [bacterium]|nr:hypothetical protein [bacterium]
MRNLPLTSFALGSLLCLGSCEALGSMDTSLEGIVAGASKLAGSLTTMLDGVGAGQLLEGTGLDSLGALIQTGKGLLGNLEGVPADSSGTLSLDGLKGALGSLANFDLGSLQNATTAEGQSGLLAQLKSIAGNIGSEASTLQQSMQQ